MSSLVVTSDLDLFDLKSTHFISDFPNCTEVVNLAKFSQAVVKTC